MGREVELVVGDQYAVPVRKPETALLTVLDAEVPFYGVVRQVWSQDDDFGQGNYDKSRLVEVYLDPQIAARRARALQEEEGEVHEHMSFGEFSYNHSGIAYKVGGPFLGRLCVVGSLELAPVDVALGTEATS
jgi:hypothetical protein